MIIHLDILIIEIMNLKTINKISLLEKENKKIFAKIISDILNIDPTFNDAFYNDYIFTDKYVNRNEFIKFIKGSIYWKKGK